MRIIRVFPTRTSFTPADELAFVGPPPLLRPEADAVHISCTFSWDMAQAQMLRDAWAEYYPQVLLGGPAFNDPGDIFVPGKYLREGITITSRGCPKHCGFCFVPNREGHIRELPIAEGNMVQDNNLLACSRGHIERVLAMLRAQRKAVSFRGGLDTTLLKDWFVDELRGMRIKEIWLAADSAVALGPLEKAVQKLSWLGRGKLRCYVLIGFQGETLQQAEARLRRVGEIGCLPFAQLYRGEEPSNYSKEWRSLSRIFSRPAATKTLMAETPGMI